MFEWVLTVAPTGQEGGGSGAGGGGSLGSCSRLGLGGKRGEREECGVLTFVEKYLCSRGGSRKPAASRRNLLHVSRGVFSNKTRFVFAHEDHLCHRTDFLFEALVAMLRACVFLRRHHTFPRQLLEWSMRSHIPSKSRVRVDLNFS